MANPAAEWQAYATYHGSYRAAVIGHTGQGNYGHGLDLAFTGLPRVEVVAVADPDAAGRERAMQRTGAVRGYPDYRELLERERPEVVAVATRWPEQHEAMVLAAARAGVKGIYCEKPLAPAPDAADRMLAACDAQGIKLNVAHQNRMRPTPHFVRDLIAQGRIGRLRAIRTFGKHDHRSGGEDLLVLGTHLLDLMRFFAGTPARWCQARVLAQGREATPADVGASRTERLGPLAGDEVVATYGFDGGVTGTFESARLDDGGGSPYFRIELCGTTGIIAFWSDPGGPVYFHPRPYALPAPQVEWQPLAPPAMPEPRGAPPAAGGFFASNQAMVCDLLAAVEEGRQTASSGHEALAALEMILAVYESHVTGRRATLPLENRTHPLERWV